MQVQIQTPTREVLTLDVNPCDAVGAFRQRLAPLVGIAAEHQRLTFGGRCFEDGRVLLEYGIRPGREGSIIIELSEVHSRWTLPTIGEDGRVVSDKWMLRSSCCTQSSQIIGKQSFQSSESSTCAPSDCGSDIGDMGSLGFSTSDVSLLSASQSPLSSHLGAYTSLVSSVRLQQEQRVLDAFVEANAARVQYLLMRRQRLEATGYGVRALCE